MQEPDRLYFLRETLLGTAPHTIKSMQQHLKQLRTQRRIFLDQGRLPGGPPRPLGVPRRGLAVPQLLLAPPQLVLPRAKRGTGAAALGASQHHEQVLKSRC